MWRDIKDYVQDHPLEIGESVRTRHHACAHRSVDNTLEIRRTDDGTCIGYCHRCGIGSGYYGGEKHPTFRKSQQPNQTTTKGAYVPDTYAKTLSESPPEVRLWLAKSCIPLVSLEAEGVQWNDTRLRVEFPVGRGKVFRHYAEGLPKYTSRVPFQLRRHEMRQEQTLCVVEDWLSCYQCYRAGYDSLALFTTSIRTAAMAEVIGNNYTRVLIMLDNDNVTVKKNQRKLLRQFSACIDDVSIVQLEKDPKEYPITELQEIVK